MNAIQIISQLDDYGVEMTPNGDKIKFLFDKTNPPPKDLIEAAREHKLEIIAELNIRIRGASAEPYIMKNGDLCIPFNSDKKFHWWDGGMSAAETRKHLLN